MSFLLSVIGQSHWLSAEIRLCKKLTLGIQIPNVFFTVQDPDLLTNCYTQASSGSINVRALDDQMD